MLVVSPSGFSTRAAGGGLNAGRHHWRSAQFGELLLQSSTAAVMKAMHGALRLFQRGGDFNRREAGDVPEDEYLALVFGQLLERKAKIASTLLAHLGLAA